VHITGRIAAKIPGRRLKRKLRMYLEEIGLDLVYENKLGMQLSC
jgi:hypothetical protein